MSLEPRIQKKRHAIAVAAHDMLNGTISFIEGARLINQLRFGAGLADFDSDIIVFIGIDSETDALPMGDIRRLWANEALAKLQPKIDKAQQWARDIGRPHCQKLIERFGFPSDEIS